MTQAGHSRDTGRCVILGCGRWSMGDDQAGLRVGERLRERARGRAEVLCDESPGLALAQLEGSRIGTLLVIDAAPADAAHPAGTFTVLCGDPRQRLIGRSRPSTHEIDVANGLDLMAAWDGVPPRIRLYVIFAAQFARSLSMSPEVASCVDEVVERVLQDLDQDGREA
ncbi:MAG: hydrogenase maturation protease [Phycisphaerales bacterium]|nr:hydrogenase maturation protease [Phycisphaerales bacterium]